MKYWEDMQSKYGFSDGEAVPEGAEVYREVYIAAVNAMAEKLGCAQRAVPYDRPGVHNWCLILFEPANGEGLKNPDAKMQEAIELCQVGDWDSFVRVTVEQVEDFEESLSSMINACIEEGSTYAM